MWLSAAPPKLHLNSVIAYAISASIATASGNCLFINWDHKIRIVLDLISQLEWKIADMKVLIVGASGMIGGEVLSQCLAHPDISHVIAFVRRDLPEDVSSHPKLQTVIIKDFANWPEDVLQAHADASAMIW